MYTALRAEDFDTSYTELEHLNGNEEDEQDSTNEYCYEATFLYHYIVFSFQYVDGNLRNYRSIFMYRFFQGMRLFSVVLMTAFLVFKIYVFNFLYRDEMKSLDMFKKIVIIIVKVLSVAKYNLLHLAGIYLFWKYPLQAQLELQSLFRRTKCEEKLVQKLKIVQRKTNKTMRWVLLLLIGPSIFVNFFPMILEIILNTRYPWKVWWMELIDLLRVVYVRLASLPFFFYLIHISSLQILHLQEYFEYVTSPDNKESMDQSFQRYFKVHSIIQKSVGYYDFFLRVVFGVIVSLGTVYAYFAISFYKTVLSNNEGDSGFTITAIEYFVYSFKTFIETIVLFTLPLTMLHRVEEQEKALASRLCQISYSTMPNTFALNTLQKVLDFVRQMMKFQKNEKIGYQVFGVSLSRVKTIWLITLSPLAYHVANAIIKGNL